MKGLELPLENKVRNATEMREFMQEMGLSEATIERAVKLKYNLPEPEAEQAPVRSRSRQKAAVSK
jgi:hypothetical protein